MERAETPNATHTIWTGSYAGLRLGSGTLGALEMAREYNGMGLPAEVSAVFADPVAGQSGRYAMHRSFSGTGRIEQQTRASALMSHDTLSRDQADHNTGWRAARGLPPKLEELGISLPQDFPASAAQETSMLGQHDAFLRMEDFVNGAPVHADIEVSPTDYQLQSRGSAEYQHDPLGNRETEGIPGQSETRYHHDWANRLLAVTAGDGSLVKRFRYDPLGRRVLEVTPDNVGKVRVHWGAQVVSENTIDTSGQSLLAKRNYWSEALDQLIAYDLDNGTDGNIDDSYSALTDAQGTVQSIVNDQGKQVESYMYGKDGSFLIYGEDNTLPKLKYAVVMPADETEGRAYQTAVLVFSEQVQQAQGTAAILDAEGVTVNGPWALMEDGRIWWAGIDPALEHGVDYTLMVDGFQDLSGNEQNLDPVVFNAGTPEALLEIVPGAAKALTGDSPVVAVVDGPGQVVVMLDLPLDPAAVTNDTLRVSKSGQPIAGTVTAFRPQMTDRPSRRPFKAIGRENKRAQSPPFPYVLKWTPVNEAEFQVDPTGTHQYELQIDLSTGTRKALAEPIDPIGFYHLGLGHIVAADEPDSPLLDQTAVGNHRMLHGRPYLTDLGLYDHRARFYDPKTLAFLQPDPLGPVDSPNLYQGFGGNRHKGG